MSNNKTSQHKIIKSEMWLASASVLLTIFLLLIGALVTYKWNKGQNSDTNILIGMFSIFNILETFTSLYLILGFVRREYNNRVILEILISNLKRQNIIEENWLERVTNFVDKDVTDGY